MNRREFIRTGSTTVAHAAAGPLSAAPPTRPHVPGPRSEVRRHRGQPHFFLDGQPALKPVFETYAPETKFFRQFTEAGTDVFSFSTNLGDGFSTPTWRAPDQWDFKTLLVRYATSESP